MCLQQPRFGVKRKLQHCSAALASLAMWSEAAWAHTGPDGGGHHEILSLAHHLTDLQAWLAGLSMSPWIGLAAVAVAAGAWLAGRPVFAKYKHDKHIVVGKAHAKDTHAKDQQ